MTAQEPHKDKDMIFRIEAAFLPKLDAWMRTIEEKVAREQVRTGRFLNGTVIDEGTIQFVKDSLERGEPQPYYGAIGGGLHILLHTHRPRLPGQGEEHGDRGRGRPQRLRGVVEGKVSHHRRVARQPGLGQH